MAMIKPKAGDLLLRHIRFHDASSMAEAIDDLLESRPFKSRATAIEGTDFDSKGIAQLYEVQKGKELIYVIRLGS